MAEAPPQDAAIDELRRLMGDVQTVRVPRSAGDSTATVMYVPTIQAVLARRGYLTKRTLGCGSYSKVKLALKYTVEGDQVLLESPQQVAVKIVNKRRAPKDYQSKFMPRELRIWPRLKHPNIMPLVDLFMDQRFVYMVLPCASGGDLLNYIQKNGAQRETVTHRWMCQVGSAIKYMHDMGITHRDLKLENVLLIDPDTVSLCDFGFVKGNCTSHSDLSATYCGSKSYASPEILNGRPYDPRKADVWAIGVVAYIVITGRMPFDESRGTKSMLTEQRTLDFDWPVPSLVSPAFRRAVLHAFTWSFISRPTIDQLLGEPWFAGRHITAGSQGCGDTHPAVSGVDHDAILRRI